MIALIAIAIFVMAYILILTEWIPKTLAALIGAVLMLFVGVVQYCDFWSLIDFRTIGVVFGLSVIVSVSNRSNIFSFIGIKAVKFARTPKRILTLLVVLTVVFSTFLSNISSMIIMAALTIIVCKTLRLNAKPFLLAEAFATNIGGLVMIISSIPNIIVASASDISFIAFAMITVPLSVILTLVSLWFFRRFFYLGKLEDPEVIDRLDAWSVVEDRRLFWKTAILISITLALFFMSDFLPFTLDIIAIACAIVFLLVTSHSVSDAVHDVDWETLIFFIGLFIMVGALENIGVLEAIGTYIGAVAGTEMMKNVFVFTISAIASGVIDNIPLTAAMAPVVSRIATGPVTWFALVFAANLGGNLTPIGSPSNVIAFGIAKKEDIGISFLDYIKSSGILAAITLVVSFGYLLAISPFLG